MIERGNHGLHGHHIWRTALLGLLIRDTPGFDNVATMRTSILDLCVITHCRDNNGGEVDGNEML